MRMELDVTRGHTNMCSYSYANPLSRPSLCAPLLGKAQRDGNRVPADSERDDMADRRSGEHDEPQALAHPPEEKFPLSFPNCDWRS